MCNDVRPQNILVLYNRHDKQSQHISPTDVVDQSLQGLFIPLVLLRYRQAAWQRDQSVFSPQQARH